MSSPSHVRRATGQGLKLALLSLILLACNAQKPTQPNRDPFKPQASIAQEASVGSGSRPAVGASPFTSLSGLAHAPLTPIVDEAWQAIEQKGGHPLPVAALFRVKASFAAPCTKMIATWLLTNSRQRLVELSFSEAASAWCNPLGSAQAPPHANQSESDKVSQFIRHFITDLRQRRPTQQVAPLSFSPAEVQALGARFHQDVSLLSIDKRVPKTNKSSEARVLSSEVVFVERPTPGVVQQIRVHPQTARSNPPRWQAPFDVNEPEILSRDQPLLALQTALAPSPITPFLNWTIRLIQNASAGEPLRQGYLPLASRDVFRPLFRDFERLDGPLTVKMSHQKIEVALAQNKSITLDLLLLYTGLKIIEVKRHTRTTLNRALRPEIDAVFHPILRQIRKREIDNFLVSQANSKTIENIVGPERAAKFQSKLPTRATLIELGLWLEEHPRPRYWTIGDPLHLAFDEEQSAYAIGFNFTSSPEQVNTNNLFTVKKIHRN